MRRHLTIARHLYTMGATARAVLHLERARRASRSSRQRAAILRTELGYLRLA